MPARSIYTPSRWEQWQPTSRMWLPPSLLLLLFGSLLVFVDCVAPSREMADVRGAATQHGSGMVSSVSYIPLRKGGTDASILVSLLVAGETVTFTTQTDLHKNEAVQVTYRVGKSGRIHIDDVKPEGEAKP